MSHEYVSGLVIPDNIIRDFMDSVSAAANITRDIFYEGRAVGLDFFIRNRGAAALTVSIDGQTAITVDAGDVYRLNGVKFTRINIASAVTFDCQYFGVLVDTLKKRGIM